MPEETTTEPVPVESPPPAAQPQREDVDEPRVKLHRLAAAFSQTPSRSRLIEFLRLRRSLM